MTPQEIKELILTEGTEKASVLIYEAHHKQRDKDSYIWFGILAFFCIVFVGYLNQYGLKDSERLTQELFKEREINLRNKQINDSLGEYMKEYPVLVIDPTKKP